LRRRKRTDEPSVKVAAQKRRAKSVKFRVKFLAKNSCAKFHARALL